MQLKKLDQDAGLDTSDVAAKEDFITLNAAVGKLDINKLTNVSTRLTKTKVDNLDVGKLKNVPADLMSQIIKLLKTQNSTH